MKNKTFLNATVAGAAVLFLAGLAHAQFAEVPFYAGNQIKPNVMIMLDTSGSMEWDINGCTELAYRCTYLGTNRIEIAKYVLTGSGAIPVQFEGYNVYMGDPNGPLTVRASLTNPFTRILRINASYQPEENGEYFVFADSDDIGFGDFSNTPPDVINNCQGGNCPSSKNMDKALTTLDQYLWARQMFELNLDARSDITDGGISKQRDIYTAVPTGGSLTPRDAFVQHYWDVNRTVRVFPVIYIAECYYSWWRWRACYRPDPSGNYFVFFDSDDYDVSVSDPDARLWAVDLLLRDYLASKGTSSYRSYGTGNVCGDSTSSNCPDDGRNETRDLYQWVANGTVGATVFVNRTPTEDEVRAALVGGIPKVTLTDVINPDGRFGPDFTLDDTPGNSTLDYAARMGLEIPQPSSTNPLNYIDSAFTYVNTGVTYHFFDGKDANGDGKFDGMTYGQKYYELDPGLLDIYTNIRWGLAKFDNGGNVGGSNCTGNNTDFLRCGANLLVSLPDEYSTGISADAARNNVQDQIIALSPDGWTPLADSMRNMYEYFFAPASLDDLLDITGRNDTNPTMYVDHECDLTPDDHIVQADKAYTSTTTEGNLGCRRNFVIFVTDGEQTMGDGCTGFDVRNCPLSTVIPRQKYWIEQLKQDGDIWQGVKVFLIGFALQGNPNAMAQLEGMADASKMDSDDPYDYAFYANNEDELKATLATIFNIIMSGAYTRSAPVLNPNETAIVAGYFVVNPDKVMWEGHLELYDLALLEDPDNLGSLMPVADGASVLNQTNSNDRDIFTAQPVSGSNNWAYRDGSLVRWDKLDFVTSQASTLLTLLRPGNQDGDTALNEVEDAQVLISFIRGTAEDSPQVTFKNGDERTWTLGAVNRSIPVIVGPPGGEAEESFLKYEFFLEKYKDRPSLTYVGANDGMLHAFFLFFDLKGNLIPEHERQMEEAFAYIPYEVLPTLRILRENQWYYVDGSPVAADVFLPQPLWMADVEWDDTTKRAAAGCDEVGGERFCWRSMIVCGLGQGGRDYFALDVSDADSISASDTGTPAAEKIHTFWEFTDRYMVAGDTEPRDRLGDTWSRPFLAELWLGDGNSTWVAAVFGGGQSAEGEDPDIGNYIYFVNADDASILRRFMVPDKDDPHWWDKVEAGLWNDDPSSDDYFASWNNLPSDPTVVDAPPQEGLSELLYMGDLQGRMWKVNMASGDTTEWELGLLWDTGDREGEYTDEEDLPKPCDPPAPCDPDYPDFDALRRPIFYAPTVIEAPESGLIVIFGTGHIEDKVMARDETMINCIFAVWDKDPVIKIGTEDITSYGTLWSETQREEHCPGCIGDITYPFCFEPGEKIITKPKVDEGVLKFQTFVPFSNNPCASSFNPCKPGVVRIWYVDYLTFLGIYNLPGEGGRYLELEDFTTSRFTSGNKGDYYMVPPGGPRLYEGPPSKDSDILSWGEGISFDW